MRFQDFREPLAIVTNSVWGSQTPSFEKARDSHRFIFQSFSKFSRILLELAQAPKLFDGNAQLSKNFEEEWRPDFASTVYRDRHTSTVRASPAFVTSRRAAQRKTK
jgi:hypothetical protein